MATMFAPDAPRSAASNTLKARSRIPAKANTIPRRWFGTRAEATRLRDRAVGQRVHEARAGGALRSRASAPSRVAVARAARTVRPARRRSVRRARDRRAVARAVTR